MGHRQQLALWYRPERRFSTIIISTVAAATITLDYYDNISVNSFTLGNSDTLLINQAAALSTTGNFTNSGSLTLDAGGHLSVGGKESETSSATINDQIGDTPASGSFSVLAVTGTVTLAGTFNLALVNGFTPSIGQDFPVITFASAGGGQFSTVTGLAGAGSSFTETLKAKSLDLIVQPTPPTFTARFALGSRCWFCVFVSVPGQRHGAHHLFRNGSTRLGPT